VDDAPIRGRGESQIFQQFLARYDVPAYVRRARQVQDELDYLVARCRQKRDEWLVLVRIRVGQLQALAGDWSRLGPWLADADQVRVLHELHALLSPRLRLPLGPTSSGRALRRALREVSESIQRFNQRWREFIPTVDLSRVNEARDGYNRYYLLEKECAVRSARLARQGFRRLEPMTTDELAALLPPLPVPRMRA